VDAERKARFEAAFDALCAGGSTITVATLAALLEQIGVCARGTGAAFLKEWDVNGDNNISKAEYVSCVM